MSIKKLKEELAQCKQQMNDWGRLPNKKVPKNKILWKKYFNRAVELEKQIEELENESKSKKKVVKKKKVKKVKKKPKKKYHPSDVDKDGDVDFHDVLKVAKDAVKKKIKKSK